VLQYEPRVRPVKEYEVLRVLRATCKLFTQAKD
jgi:hypothetical protein